jgi:hypothetical protein
MKMKREFIGEKMLVNDDCEPYRWDVRIVLFINRNGTCVVVKEIHEQNYIKGDKFETCGYDRCKPIPKKIIDKEDALYWRHTHPTVLVKYSDDIRFASHFAYENIIGRYSACLSLNGLKEPVWTPLTEIEI